jgi:hypothetical protein
VHCLSSLHEICTWVPVNLGVKFTF